MQIKHVYNDRQDFTDRLKRFGKADGETRRMAIAELRYRSESGREGASSSMMAAFFSLIGVMFVAAVNVVLVIGFTSGRIKEGPAEARTDLGFVLGFFFIFLLFVVLQGAAVYLQHRSERRTAIAAMWLAEYERIDHAIRTQQPVRPRRRFREHPARLI